WKRAEPLRYEWSDDVIKPQYVIEEISNITNGEALVVTGVGQHQKWAAQYYRFKHPRTLCTSGGLGTMGYGLPTSVGMQAGIRATKPSEVVPALEKMIATPGPVLLDVWVNKDECVFPMVPAGGANTDMILAHPSHEARERAAKSQTGF